MRCWTGRAGTPGQEITWKHLTVGERQGTHRIVTIKLLIDRNAARNYTPRPTNTQRLAYPVMTLTSAGVIDRDGLERETYRDRKLELFVWSMDGCIAGFELHYAIHSTHEWSMRWTSSEGTTYHRVDHDSIIKGRKELRVMRPMVNELPAVRDMQAEFAVRGRLIDDAIRNIVLKQLSRASEK